MQIKDKDGKVIPVEEDSTLEQIAAMAQPGVEPSEILEEGMSAPMPEGLLPIEEVQEGEVVQEEVYPVPQPDVYSGHQPEPARPVPLGTNKITEQGIFVNVIPEPEAEPTPEPPVMRGRKPSVTTIIRRNSEKRFRMKHQTPGLLERLKATADRTFKLFPVNTGEGDPCVCPFCHSREIYYCGSSRSPNSEGGGYINFLKTITARFVFCLNEECPAHLQIQVLEI